MTMLEQIFSAHTSGEVVTGEVIWLELDIRSARDFGGANVVQNLKKNYDKGEEIQDTEKTFFTFDCVAPANNIPYANNQHICRKFAREHGIKVFDVDRGIGSHVLLEEGLAKPWGTIVGTDSHLNLLGAIGAFGQGMGDQDIAFGIKTGKTWFEVPETMKVKISGLLQPPCTAKDLTLAILRKLGSKGALGKAIEFSGDAIDQLDLTGRITLSSMVTEMGGIIGLIPPDEKVLRLCKQASDDSSIRPIVPDEDATYCKTVHIDISNLKPLIACPPTPSNIKEVDEVAGIPVDSVFIGSCTNGRFEDLELASRILQKDKVAEKVMLKVVPATKNVYGQLLNEGLISVLFQSGAIIGNPSCAGCASGQIGMTGKDEVQISTGNRNFEGKQGAGDTYLVSPATAAASAIAGEIVPPK